MVCIINSIHDFISSHIEIEHYFTSIVWSLNILLLLFFLVELHLRDVQCRKIPHAYLMVMSSMICSIISSTFFLVSQDHFFFNTSYLINKTCLYGPIVAISFRFIAKHFTWAFYVIRGQLVMESLDTNITKIAKKAPYMLIIQCLIITTLIILCTQSQYISSTNSCYVVLPLWLLICSALFGELLYGLGFMYLFYEAMTVSMDHVYNSISPTHSKSIKRQIRHHMYVYSVQLITALIFLSLVSLCVCFDTLVFFEAELFISNVCLMALFRNKKKLFSKLLCCNPESTMESHLSKITKSVNNVGTAFRAVFSESNITTNTSSDIGMANHESIKKFVSTAVDSENFLADNWRGDQTVHNLKAALKLAEAAPKLNSKALEMLGVTTTKHRCTPSSTFIYNNDTADSETLDVNIECITSGGIRLMKSHSDPLAAIYDDRTWGDDDMEGSDVSIEHGLKLNRSESEPRVKKLSFATIGTQSDPLWTMSLGNGNKKQSGTENSPSAHLLDDDDADFMNTVAELQHSTSLTASLVKTFKKGMKRMSMIPITKPNISNGKGSSASPKSAPVGDFDQDGTVFVSMGNNIDLNNINDVAESNVANKQLDEIIGRMPLSKVKSVSAE